MDLTPLTVWITGYSGSGKTTLIERLIPLLHPLQIATAKHHHRMRQLDRPGTDTARHQKAGATASILSGPAGTALFLPAEPPPLADLLQLVRQVDLVLVEGFTRQARLAVRLRDTESRLRPLPKGCRTLATLPNRFTLADVKALATRIRALLPKPKEPARTD